MSWGCRGCLNLQLVCLSSLLSPSPRLIIMVCRSCAHPASPPLPPLPSLASFDGDPVSCLSRIWCIYEIICSVRAHNPLVVMLPAEEQYRFLKALEEDSSVARDAFAHVDVTMAEAHDPDDKAHIVDEMEQIDGGAVKVNETVINAMNGAMADLAVKWAGSSFLWGGLATNTALYLSDLGRLQEARTLAESVAVRREAEAPGMAGEGETDPEVAYAIASATLDARGDVGGIMSKQGELEAARAVLEAVVAGWEEMPGSGMDERALGRGLGAKGSLANVMVRQGDLPGARSLNEEIIETRTAQAGPTHRSTLGTKSNLATVLKMQGDLPGARALYEQVIEAQAAQLRPSHPRMLTTQGNLAAVMQLQGDFAGAQALYEQVIEAQTAQLGSSHQSTLDVKGNLAILLHTMAKAAEENGERAEAAGLYGKAAGMYELKYGPEDETLAECRAKARGL